MNRTSLSVYLVMCYMLRVPGAGWFRFTYFVQNLLLISLLDSGFRVHSYIRVLNRGRNCSNSAPIRNSGRFLVARRF